MKQSFEMAKQVEKKIVFLRLEKKSGPGLLVKFIGTGFVIDRKYLITNYHIYKMAKENSDSNFILGFYESKIADAGVVRYKNVQIHLDKTIEDIDNDLVAIELDETLPDSNSFLKSDLVENGFSEDFKMADEAIYCGFPLATEFLQIGVGLTLFVNKCIVAALKYNAAKKNIHLILIDSHVNPSSSGSPLISLSSEKILGVVSGTFHQNFISSTASENIPRGLIQIPRNIGLVRPSNYIFQLINEIESKIDKQNV